MCPPPASPAGPAALPVSAPPRVRDHLMVAPDGPVPVLHHGPMAVYVDIAGRCVGVLAAGAARVPCGLRSRIRAFSTGDGVFAYLERGVLHLGSRPLPVGRAEDVHTPRLDRGRVPSNTANSATCSATPPAAVAEFVASTAPSGVDPGAVRRLLGRGEGLTPLGDDVLCGWLAAHRAFGVPTPAVDAEVRAGAGRTTLLSATLLDCALEGEVLPELGAWLAALARPEHLPAAARALVTVGATSGAGLLAGAQLAVRSLLTEEVEAA